MGQYSVLLVLRSGYKASGFVDYVGDELPREDDVITVVHGDAQVQARVLYVEPGRQFQIVAAEIP